MKVILEETVAGYDVLQAIENILEGLSHADRKSYVSFIDAHVIKADKGMVTYEIELRVKSDSGLKIRIVRPGE